MTQTRKPYPLFRTMGDRSLLIDLGEGISPETNDRVRGLSKVLEQDLPQGFMEAIPAYRSLLVVFDPRKTTSALIRAWIESHLSCEVAQVITEPKIMDVPVVYGGEFGPDLEWVAHFHGTTEAEVIRLHTSISYRVYMIGFMPGFAYMGELPEALNTPRKETPRVRVPRGSVAIAQRQTGIYPSESPGGWQIVGRTPLRLFDPASEPPTPIQAGDRVRFIPIRQEEVESWKG